MGLTRIVGIFFEDSKLELVLSETGWLYEAPIDIQLRILSAKLKQRTRNKVKTFLKFAKTPCQVGQLPPKTFREEIQNVNVDLSQ